MQSQSTNEENEKLRAENRKLLEENNALLKKIHRNILWTFWLRIAWYAVLIGLPFAFYFYIVEPYFEALGSDYGKFQEGIREIPGLKSFYEAFEEEQ